MDSHIDSKKGSSSIERLMVLALALALFASQGAAQVASQADSNGGEGIVTESLHQLVQPTPIAGLDEASFGSTIYYLSDNRDYLIVGELFDLTRKTNLTETRRRRDRMRLLNSISPEDTISFQPHDTPTRHAVFVFVALDCPFCKKFHAEMAELLRRGFEVHYLIHANVDDAAAWAKARTVICAEDRNAALSLALTRAETVTEYTSPNQGCDPAALYLHQQLARAIGVKTVPAIITDYGSLILGYTGYEWLLSKAADASLPEWSMDQANRLYQSLGATPIVSTSNASR